MAPWRSFQRLPLKYFVFHFELSKNSVYQSTQTADDNSHGKSVLFGATSKGGSFWQYILEFPLNQEFSASTWSFFGERFGNLSVLRGSRSSRTFSFLLRSTGKNQPVAIWSSPNCTVCFLPPIFSEGKSSQGATTISYKLPNHQNVLGN